MDLVKSKLGSIKGKEGIRKLMESALNNEEKVLRTALSGKPLVYLVDQDFANTYMKKRKEKGIFLKSLRFTEEDVDLPSHKDYRKYNKEARICSDSKIASTLVIWDDKVAVVDPVNMEGFILIDAGYAETMKAWFDLIWEQSS